MLVPLGLVLFTVISKGASAISWQFLTAGTIPPNVLPVTFGGMGPAVYGTLVITGFAALMAIPLGVLGGIYINEYGGNQVLARVINFFADVMTGGAVNHHGPVHLHDLGAALRVLAVRGRPRPRLPDARLS